MSLNIGDTLPPLVCESTKGKLDLDIYLDGSMGVIFTYGEDFSSVATTELGYLARINNQFLKRGVKLLAFGREKINDHQAWMKDINETQRCYITFPILSDATGDVGKKMGFQDFDRNRKEGTRELYLVSSKKEVLYYANYPQTVGRDFDELLRIIDSLSLFKNHQVATPVNWRPGEDCLVWEKSTTSSFSSVREVRPYLKATPQPKLEEQF